MPGFDFGEAAIDAYKAIPLHIRQIFAEYTPIIEPLSLDEAYLDVTESKGHQLGDTNLRRYRLFGPVSGENEQRLVARAPFLRGRGAVCLLAWNPACWALCELPNRAGSWRTSIRRCSPAILEPQTSCTNQPRRLRAPRMPFQVSAMPSPAAATST
jgi:nucleotidyltransferase/DNA polymerase involved in DNA repair